MNAAPKISKANIICNGDIILDNAIPHPNMTVFGKHGLNQTENSQKKAAKAPSANKGMRLGLS